MDNWLEKMKEQEARKMEAIQAFHRRQMEAGEDAISSGLTGAEYAAYVEGSLSHDTP
jgi:hypothetical protein